MTTAPAVKARQETSRMAALDLLRFFAALSVVFYHYLFRGWQHGEFFSVRFDLGRFFRFGYMGVELFFVISGFVILVSCHGRSAREFVRSRVIRLYPAYMLCVVVTWLVTTMYGATTLRVSTLQMAVNLTMLQQFFGVKNVDGVYWTLTRELLFYALVFVCLWRRWLARLEVPLAIWLAWSVVAMILPVNRFIVALTDADYSGYFIAGAAIFLLSRHGTTITRIALLACSAGLMQLQAVTKAARLVETTGLPHPWWLLLIVNLGIVLAVLVVAFRRVQLGPLAGLAAQLGALTYPLYLLHAHLGYVLMTYATDATKWRFALGGAGVMLVLAWAIVHWWEHPVQRYLRSALTPRGRRALTASGEREAVTPTAAR